MKKVFYIHTCILILVTVCATHAQTDPLFLQQTNVRGLINPATTGKGGDVNASLSIRQQWIGFPGTSTQALLANGFIRDLRSGLGLKCIIDEFGPQQTKNIKLNYAYFVPFDDIAFLSLGIGMGMMSNIYDETAFYARDENDPVTADVLILSKILPDFDFGFEFNTRFLEAGASITHITYGYSDQNIVRPMRNFFAYSRVKLPINKYWDFIPGITWHHNRKMSTYEANAAFRYNNNVCVNIVYRNPMDIGVALGMNIFGGLRAAYSYDCGFDSLSNYNSGSHEITLSYTIPVNNSYIRNRLRFFRWKMF